MSRSSSVAVAIGRSDDDDEVGLRMFVDDEVDEVDEGPPVAVDDDDDACCIGWVWIRGFSCEGGVITTDKLVWIVLKGGRITLAGTAEVGTGSNGGIGKTFDDDNAGAFD